MNNEWIDSYNSQMSSSFWQRRLVFSFTPLAAWPLHHELLCRHSRYVRLLGPSYWLRYILLLCFRLEGSNTVKICWNMMLYPVVYHPKVPLISARTTPLSHSTASLWAISDLGGFPPATPQCFYYFVFRQYLANYCWPHLTHKPPT